ncbi:MAG: nitrate reductase catalytic subunit [Pirellulaceae bacterium]|nr:MAG: nitrate reductase catalytic subunit [Pirellulaceae bacterium]
MIELLPIIKRTGAMTEQLRLRPGPQGLGMLPDGLLPQATTTGVCGFCSTGCGLTYHLRHDQAVGVTPNAQYPVNLGAACPKGWEALRVLESESRATVPLSRDSGGQLLPVTWDQALDRFCGTFKELLESGGPDAVAVLGTGQITCEELAFLGSLTKFGFGWRHADGNTRQCMATAVSAYKRAFGFDAPPFCYDDLEQSDCLVMIGANPCIGHPILWERFLLNRRRPNLIVVDPRRTETAAAASIHLPIRPKSDLCLLYAWTKWMIEHGAIDQAFIDQHTSGFDQLRAAVRDFPISRAAAETGVAEEWIVDAAQRIAAADAASFWWTMGVNQSYQGTATAQAIINLALITGNIGRPGTGANSITGQCNAMGSRLWSNTTSLLGQFPFEDQEARRKIAEVLHIPSDRIPTSAGWAYDEIMEGIRRGRIRGLWVVGTNPAHSWIEQGGAIDLLKRLDFLVVQDMYCDTETARIADLILPAAGWGEKEGTLINSERRYGVVRQVRRAPGQALSDFRIFQALARRWGVAGLFSEWSSPASVFALLQKISRSTPHDITGIRDYDHIASCGGIQWPWTAEDAAGGDPPTCGRRLFTDGTFFTPDGRARLEAFVPQEMPETPDDEFPFMLLTGRGTVAQWHTQTRTRCSPILQRLYPQEAYIEMHPQDARRLKLTSGMPVAVRSRRGQVRVRLLVTSAVAPGQLFMPMHYAETNQLTLSHFDPISRQPSYKDCAVAVDPWTNTCRS